MLTSYQLAPINYTVFVHRVVKIRSYYFVKVYSIFPVIIVMEYGRKYTFAFVSFARLHSYST